MNAAAESIRLYAAGSLRSALTDVARAFESATGHTVAAEFGPSGLLRDRIAAGAPAHVFASANMEHPQSLANSGRAGSVSKFARNTLCALVRPGLVADSSSLLAFMLDPAIRLAASTSKTDPSGDYAFAVFGKADAVQPGARAKLEAKAVMLTGAAESATPPAGLNVYGWHVADGRADIFLTYRTNAIEAQAQNPGQQIVALPPALAVGADYGLTIINNAPLAAMMLADFIVSASGQAILRAHGFAAPDEN